MNGAECLLRTLVNGGVEVCFTNPGTSEMAVVAALDEVPGVRPVLGLFEGVVSGAADGYARMADKPAAALLHLGPGLANGLANFHNAMRANVPIVNIVGDHATSHAKYESPLSSDIASYARPVSGWIRSNKDAKTLAADTAAAIVAARTAPGRIATLIVPADSCWDEGGEPALTPNVPGPSPVSPDAVKEAARALTSGAPSVILMTGQTLREEGIELASRIANKTGARLMCQYFNARLQRGVGRPLIERLPYFAEKAVEALTGTKHLVLVGAKPPVAFFAYPGKPSSLTPDGCATHVLSRPEEDGIRALEALADELGAARTAPTIQQPTDFGRPTGSLDPNTIALSVAAGLPEGAIVSDETVSSGLNALPLTAGARPHDWLFLTGGAIGQGLPLGTGAAIACPDRKVVCLEGDGSAMYTLQALWTQARERLDVTTVIYANRKYKVLQLELQRVGVERFGPKTTDLVDIDRPELDWVRLASGMGVNAHRVTTVEAFADRFASAMSEPGPHLIEAVF